MLEACNGINNLPDKNTRIPVFASKILSNPHGFDKKNLSGKIFVMLLSYIDGRKSPKNSEELAELYYKYHLLIDDVSNMILCKNIIGIKDNRQEHDGMKGFSKANEPEGMQIADKLKKRYGEKLEFFGFDVETYSNNISDVEISSERLNKLKAIENLLDLCVNVKKIKK